MPARVINKVTPSSLPALVRDNPRDLSLVLMPGATYRGTEYIKETHSESLGDT